MRLRRIHRPKDYLSLYSYGIDLTKLFSDVDAQTAADADMYKHVKFKIWNKKDKYWLTATRNEAEGVYYVTGHVTEEADATVFYPVTVDGNPGHITIKGCEDDEYYLTEIETMNGYTLLKDDICVMIQAGNHPDYTCDVYDGDALGVLQNDPHYSFNGGLDLELANIPQKQLAHNLMSAYVTIDQSYVQMLDDNGSANALAPLTVVNTQGFDLPKTGDNGTWMFSVIGILLMTGAVAAMVLLTMKKDKKQAK